MAKLCKYYSESKVKGIKKFDMKTPGPLSNWVTTTRITRDVLDEMDAYKLEQSIKDAIAVVKLNSFTDETKQFLVNDLIRVKDAIKLEDYLSDSNNKIKSIDEQRYEDTKISVMFNKTRDHKKNKKDITKNRAGEYDRVRDLMIAMFGDISMYEFDSKKLLEFETMIGRVPTRIGRHYSKLTTEEYVKLNIEDIIKENNEIKKRKKSFTKDEELELLKPEKLLSVDSKNRHLKTIRSVIIYMKDFIDTDKLYFEPKIEYIKDKESKNQKRLPFEENDLKMLLEMDGRIGTMARVYYFTGLRLDELRKSVILELISSDGKTKIKYISLMEHHTGEQVKNESSQRFIPLLDDLAEEIEDFKNYISEKKSRVERASREFSKFLRENGFGEKFTLYSLRHNFSNKLKKSKISQDVRAELMGHTHKNMADLVYADSHELETYIEALEFLKNI